MLLAGQTVLETTAALCVTVNTVNVGVLAKRLRLVGDGIRGLGAAAIWQVPALMSPVRMCKTLKADL